MPLRLKTTTSDYYDVTPTVGHNAGDIWSGLPAYGLLGQSHVRGLVVTPACDLSNRKTETLSYLPLVSLPAYFSSVCFLPEILRALRGQMVTAGIAEELTGGSRFDYPPAALVERIGRLIRSRLEGKGLGQKEKSALERSLSGIALLDAARDRSGGPPPPGAVQRLFGEKEWPKLVGEIVRNSHRTDLHFLPHDEEPAEWSGVPEHSLVLFRYPLCCPIQVLDAAQDQELADWEQCLANLTGHFPSAANFSGRRPLKHATMRPRFFSDLLTRYVAMHVRLGAPSFTDETVASFVADLTKGIQ